MNTQNIRIDQLELGFNGSAECPANRQTARGAATTHRRQTRIERAAWWFAKMRAAVENAITWTPQSSPRPHQLWFNH